MNSTKINRIIKITTLAIDIIKQENNLKNKLLFACRFECTAQKSHKKFKIETSTVIEEMKQSMNDDYSDVFPSVWNDTLFFVQFNYDSSASVMLFMYDMNIKSYSY